jgi:predicted CXXCH cytochrome family protein
LSILFGLVLLGGIGLVPAEPMAKPHMADVACGRCHLIDPRSSPAQARKLVVSQEVICRSCHANALQMSHPSGFMPQMSLPADYPADWKGDLTCSTCHEVHGTTPGLLRGAKRGQAMCLSCHQPSFFAQMKDKGTSLQQTGHLSTKAALGSQVEIDAQSLQCMGCHENKSDAMGVSVGATGIMRHNSGAANHPIGVSYPVFSRNGFLRPAGSLPKVIQLPGGKISCVSCHEVYKKEHGKLVTSNDRSALCMQCHNL